MMNKRKILKNSLPAFFAVLTSSIYQVVFLWATNVNEVDITEILKPLIIYAGIGIVAWISFSALLKNIYVGALIEIILYFIFTNYVLIEALFSKLSITLHKKNLFFIIAIILSFVVFLIRYKKKSIKNLRTVCGIISFAFGVLISINLVIAVPVQIHNSVEQNSLKKSTYQKEKVDRTSDSNIYYLLCDEYAGFEQMKEAFGFDNKILYDFLNNNNFYISNSSKNANTTTSAVLSNLMQLEYKADQYSTPIEMENYIKNSVMLSKFRDNGYIIRGVGETAWLNIPSAQKAPDMAKTMNGESFDDILRNNTILPQKKSKTFDQAVQLIYDTLTALNEMDITPESSIFTFLYIGSPHPPFFFYEDGTVRPSDEWYNSEDLHEESYIQTVKYLNSQLMPAISRIIKEDPNSIIVLCSDHGMRMTSKSNMDTKRTILNAVYYKGKAIQDFEGKSSVNTMRHILNQEFNMNMEYLDVIPR